VLGYGIAKVPVSVWDSLGCAIKPIMPGALGVTKVGDKAHKLARRLGEVKNLDDLYLSLVSEWTDCASVVKLFADEANNGDFTQVSFLNDQLPTQGVDQSQLSMMYKDSMSYLTDDIPCKVDRAAMSVSLETRFPF